MSLYFYILLVTGIIVATWQRFNQQAKFVRQIWKEVPPPYKNKRRRDKKLTRLQRSLAQLEKKRSHVSKFIGYQINFRGRIIDISSSGEVKIDLEVNKGIGTYYLHFFGNTYARFFLSIAEAKELKLKRRYSFVGQLTEVVFDNANIAVKDDAYTWVTLNFSDVALITTSLGKRYSPITLTTHFKTIAFPPSPVPSKNLPIQWQEMENTFHKLEDIIMIILCSLLSGINDWVGMENFANYREDWLRRFLDLPNGIPSHDTLRAVLARLNPTLFVEQLTGWIDATLSNLAGKPFTINDKMLIPYKPLSVNLTGVFVSEANLLDQHASINVKCNELTAIPTLLKLLKLQRAVCVIDAQVCEKITINDIIDSGADYIIALKNTQSSLHEEITQGLTAEIGAGRLAIWDDQQNNNEATERRQKNIGRMGRRRYWFSNDIDWFANRTEWSNLKALGRVEQFTQVNDEILLEQSEILSSLTDLTKIHHIMSEHCDTSNPQQWLLNIHLDEGYGQMDIDYTAENIVLMRKIALNLIRRNGSGELSIRRHRNKAMANDEYLQQLLIGKK